MNSISFTPPPQRTLPKFAGDYYPTHPPGQILYMHYDDSYQSDTERQQDRLHLGWALGRAAKKTLQYAGIPLLITSPIWATVMGVGIACNNNAPKGAIAKIKPVAGAGPAVADALCPSVYVMPNGDLMKNNAPSWTSFTNKVGHVYKNGLVINRDEVKGAYKDGRYYNADLFNGLQTIQIGADDPDSLEITLKKGTVASKTVDEDGTVKNALKQNGYHQKQGSAKLMGPYKGKSLKEVPKEEREMIKAAAAANSWTWSS